MTTHNFKGYNREFDKQIYEAAKNGCEAVLFADNIGQEVDSEEKLTITRKRFYHPVEKLESLPELKHEFETMTEATPAYVLIPVFAQRLAKEHSFEGFMNQIEVFL